MFLPLARAPVSHSTYRAPGRRPTYSNVLQNMRGRKALHTSHGRSFPNVCDRLAALAVIDGDLRSCPSHPDGFTFSSPGRIRDPDSRRSPRDTGSAFLRRTPVRASKRVRKPFFTFSPAHFTYNPAHPPDATDIPVHQVSRQNVNRFRTLHAPSAASRPFSR